MLNSYMSLLCTVQYTDGTAMNERTNGGIRVYVKHEVGDVNG